MPLLCFSSPFNKTLNKQKISAFLPLPVVHPNIPTSSPFNCSCRGRSRITAALQGKKLDTNRPCKLYKHKTTRIIHGKWKRHLCWGNNCCWQHRMDSDIPTTTTHVLKINGCEIRSWPQCPLQLRRRSFHTSVPWRMVGLKKWGVDLVAKKIHLHVQNDGKKKRTCRCQKMNLPWFSTLDFTVLLKRVSTQLAMQGANWAEKVPKANPTKNWRHMDGERLITAWNIWTGTEENDIWYDMIW